MAGEYEEKFVTVNGVKLRYLDWGSEGKPPLVCLHGHTGQAHIWDEFAEEASSSYHVYAVDQRGHGGSGRASDGYARDRFVEDLAGFVDALGLSRFTLAGLSMGGWHSLLYTADNPDRVERIVIVDIAPEPSPASASSRANRPPTPMEFATLDEAVAWAREGNPWASDARLRKDIEDKTRQREGRVVDVEGGPGAVQPSAAGHDGRGAYRAVLEGGGDYPLPHPGGSRRG